MVTLKWNDEKQVWTDGEIEVNGRALQWIRRLIPDDKTAPEFGVVWEFDYENGVMCESCGRPGQAYAYTQRPEEGHGVGVGSWIDLCSEHLAEWVELCRGTENGIYDVRTHEFVE